MSLEDVRKRRLLAYSVPILAVLAALIIGAIMLVALGADPIRGFSKLFSGAFGSTSALTETALKATPLLFVGVGITIAFRANVINIGGEGQMVAGGLLSTIVALNAPDIGPFVMIPLVLAAGLLGGAIWGAIPGALKAYYGVNEILSTIMLNVVAVQLMNYLLRGPLIDPLEVERGTRIPQTERLMESADLPVLFGRLHLGPFIAVLFAVIAYIVLWRTPLGYRVRAVGQNTDASRYAGIPVKRTIVLALTMSGALCGLAGAVLVFGSEGHRMVTDGSTAGFTGSAGFNGIVAALFGALHPLWTIPASFLFGGLLVGGLALQRAVQVPAALILALNGLVVIFVVSSERFRKRLLERPPVVIEDANDEAAATAVSSDPPEAPDPGGAETDGGAS
jgi:simple sugar transport system permease protein